MRKKLKRLVFGSLFIAVATCGQGNPPMLPTTAFEEAEKKWREVSAYFGQKLIELDERSLLQHSRNSDERVYRFVWFRSLHPTVAVFRLEVGSSGDGVLYLRLACKAEDGRLRIYRTLSKELSQRQVADFRGSFMSVSYTNLLPFIPTTGMDGSHWLLEFADQGYYHVVLRWSPQEKAIRNIGKMFLSHFDEDDLRPFY